MRSKFEIAGQMHLDETEKTKGSKAVVDGALGLIDIVADVAFCVELGTQRQLAYLFWASLMSLLSSTLVNTYAAFHFIRTLTELN